MSHLIRVFLAIGLTGSAGSARMAFAGDSKDKSTTRPAVLRKAGGKPIASHRTRRRFRRSIYWTPRVTAESPSS